MEPSDLLIADLEHFGDSLWRNEEVGEKRFSFFIALVTAVIGGLVALVTSANSPPPEMMKDIEGIVLFALLIFGLLTYLRMVQRNHVTDEYQRTLTYIRDRFVSLCPEIDSYKVPVTHTTLWSKWLKGGYAETIGVINSLLLAGFLIRFYQANPVVVFFLSILLLMLQWIRATKRRKGDYEAT